MRRTVARLAAALVLATSLAPSLASSATAQQAASQPHAFLFGAWTGGLFPPPSTVSAQQCLAQPTVIFTRDVVLHATLLDVRYVQRAIETARGTGNGIDFKFIAAGPVPQGAFGIGAPDQGFGCASPDELHVRRMTNNEISFPGCKDFPFPLVRCPAG